MDWYSLAHHGLQQPEWVLAINRTLVGTFFAISGYHKLFNAERHAALVKTLEACGVPCIRFNEWFVPTVELGAGLGVALGVLAPMLALPLIVICVVAICTDGVQRVRDWHPIDVADKLDDILYLQETLYILSLLLVIFAGPGPARLL